MPHNKHVKDLVSGKEYPNTVERNGTLVVFHFERALSEKEVRLLYTQAMEYIQDILSENANEYVTCLIDIRGAMARQKHPSFTGLKTGVDFVRNPDLKKIAILAGSHIGGKTGIPTLLKLAGIQNLREFATKKEAQTWLAQGA